ncbi:hypothetical protein BH10ACI3_BH10ACI3_14620 [soil metagenome]
MSDHENILDEYQDPDRYDSSDGWEPPDPGAKLREKHRRKHPELYCRQSMFETKTAAEWRRDEPVKKSPADLFGSLWRTGELAVLFAPSGAGKSILAVHLAESIARGKRLEAGHRRLENGSFRSPVARLSPPVSAKKVLYLDLERSAAQFNERYSCPSPIPGKLSVKYRFSNRLSFARFGDIEIPDVFGDDRARYLQHSFGTALGQKDPDVVIIDNLAYLDPRGTISAAVRWMRNLKLTAAKTGVSILVITHVKPARSGSPPYQAGVAAVLGGRGGSFTRNKLRPLALNDLAHDRIAEIADTVFAIGHSTYGPDIRYVKHLKSNYAAPSHVRTGSDSDWALSNGDDVLVFKLEHSEGPARACRVSSPHVSKGSSTTTHPDGPTEPSTKFLISPNSRLTTPHSELPKGPFLGFTYLGTAPESDLIRDYQAEALAADRARETQLKRLRTRTSKDVLVDGILDGSYARYLKGE